MLATALMHGTHAWHSGMALRLGTQARHSGTALMHGTHARDLCADTNVWLGPIGASTCLPLHPRTYMAGSLLQHCSHLDAGHSTHAHIGMLLVIEFTCIRGMWLVIAHMHRHGQQPCLQRCLHLDACSSTHAHTRRVTCHSTRVQPLA